MDPTILSGAEDEGAIGELRSHRLGSPGRTESAGKSAPKVGWHSQQVCFSEGQANLAGPSHGVTGRSGGTGSAGSARRRVHPLQIRSLPKARMAGVR
jgi:hypothetical protein